MTAKQDAVANAIVDCLRSPNVSDSNFEAANLVDTTDRMASGIYRLALAIMPNAAGGKDANGGHVESLTEAVMGVSAGLARIADAIESLADAVRHRE